MELLGGGDSDQDLAELIMSTKDGKVAGLGGTAGEENLREITATSPASRESVVAGVLILNKGQVGNLILRGDLEKLAKVSKQIREKAIDVVSGNFKQANFNISSRKAYFESIARYYEQQYGFPERSLTVSFPSVAPLSGNEVLFLSKDGRPLAVIKIFSRSEKGVPLGGEALREIESSLVLRNKNISVPEIHDVISVNNMDISNQQRPLMIVSAVANGGDIASRMRALIKADTENDRDSINGIIEEVRSVGEALGRLHDSFTPTPRLDSPDNNYDYSRMKQSIKQLYEKGEVNDKEKDRLNTLVDELFQLMEKSGIRPTVVHGDFHGGNVFIKDGKVSEFIDTETIFWSLDSEYRGIGNPANDLARFLDNLHDRLVESTVSTHIINLLEEAFLEGYSRTRNISKETLRDAIEFYKARTALVALQYSPSEYAKENAKRRLGAYLNKKSISELTEKLASGLHEGWRSPRRLSVSDTRVAQGILFEPRLKPLDSVLDRDWLQSNKKVSVYDMSRLQYGDLPVTWSEKEKINALREKGKIVIDIANAEYKDLPPSWQSENRNAAESATRLIGRKLSERKQVTLKDRKWIEEASAIIHREWLKRPANSWALNDPELNKEYSLLSEERKNENRNIIVRGIMLYDPLKYVYASSPVTGGLAQAKAVLAKNAHNGWRDGVIKGLGETELDQQGKLVTPRGRKSENTDWDQQKNNEIASSQYKDVTSRLTPKQQEALKGGSLYKMNDGAYIVRAVDGTIQLDTLNTPYESLSLAWQGKNSATVEAAAEYYQDALSRGFELDALQSGLADAIQRGKAGQKLNPEYVAGDSLKAFIVEAGVREHERWMKANAWMKTDKPELFISFADLAAGEQYKDLESFRQLVDYLAGGSSRSSSPVSSSTNELGGIDFRMMNILVQPMGSFSGLNFALPKLSNVAMINLDEEFGQIQRMVTGGITPSGARVKELIAACFEKREINSRRGEMIICLRDIFQLEEENLVETDPELKEALVILNSNRFVL